MLDIRVIYENVKGAWDIIITYYWLVNLML